MTLTKEERLKKLKEIAIPVDPNAEWRQRAEKAAENKEWEEDAFIIAFKVLDALKAQSITQRDLAQRLGVKPQAITKIVKGRQNLTLGTMRKLEAALGISLISLSKPVENQYKYMVKMVPINIHYSTTSRIYHNDVASMTKKVRKPKSTLQRLKQSA